MGNKKVQYENEDEHLFNYKFDFSHSDLYIG